MTHRLALVYPLLALVAGLAAAEIRNIPNPLGQHWPHELVSMDFPAGQIDAWQVVHGMGDPRPVQWERAVRDGEAVARAWFIARVVGETTSDEQGRSRQQPPPKALEVRFERGEVEPGIRLVQDGDYHLISNGVYDLRVRRFAGLTEPVAFEQLPHWFGGSRVAGTSSWDGKAFMQGTAQVSDVRSEIVNQGPVLVDIAITYTFTAAVSSGEVDALRLQPSKRTQFDTAAVQQRERIPALSHHYTVLLRCVAGDPWAEVVERYRLPKDPAVPDWEQHQYHIHWGETRDGLPYDRIPIPREEHVAIDTAMWVRWFEYDQFGGNNSLEIVPAEPRPPQQGRPFALLRPRWNQGGGGAQDFFLTSGGKPALGAKQELETLRQAVEERRKRAAKNEAAASELDRRSADPELAADPKQELLARKGKLRHEAREALKGLEDLDPQLQRAGALLESGDQAAAGELNRAIAATIGHELPGEGYDPTAPCYGIVAAYPSKWVGPYRGTIAAYVRPGQRAVRLGLTDGGGGEGADGSADDTWYGQRCYAIVTGERQHFDSTGEVDALVCRHTDWTLTALINRYVLDWERDPSALGPHLLMNRQRLEQLRADHAAGADTPDMRLLAKAAADYEALHAEAEALRSQLRAIDELGKRAEDLHHQARQAADAVKPALEDEHRQAQREHETARKDERPLKDELKQVEQKLGEDDFKLIALIRGDRVHAGKLPSPFMYFKRYQDDANNPTNYGNRRLVNRPFAETDLFTVDQPYGNADVAAIGYIYTDLDAWPGWQNGWNPGNPNFHTDKYPASVFAGASMPDHPHAAEWMSFGRRNFEEDVQKVLLAPDGVGWECPGYSGYAMGLQLETARIFRNSGFGNPIADNPLVKRNAIWHRKLITPYDFRIDRRHEAPHGDTHRWDSGLGAGFAELAPFYQDADPAFAAELMGTHQLLTDSGVDFKHLRQLSEILTKTELSIPATPASELDWSSQAFFGFGAILRSGFGSEQETFLSLRAGRTMGHYHNDALAFHYYADGTPIALDYNCSYHPRGDHAALHNTMTFGGEGTVRHNQRDQDVPAIEQIWSSGRLGAFASGHLADAVVAEWSSETLSMSPLDPHDHEFSRAYPDRPVERIVHRRLLTMVKHPSDSALSDYLVVRDETRSKEPQQLNLHLLARELERDGNTLRLWGQYDQDMLLHVAQATDLEVEQRWWHYHDEWMVTPGRDYEYRPGESQQQWAERMEALQADNGWTSIPGPDWKPRWKDGNEADAEHWQQLIRETDGLALLPPPGWSQDANWLYGEIQIWLRLHTAAGTPMLWVLYPYPRGGATPSFETLDGGTAVRVTLGSESEVIRLGTGLEAGAVVVERGDRRELLVERLPALGAIQDRPLE